MSTLDYASRAKNIRNKPEVNQRMTKKELIKEYIHEIERLKSDLQATREKNGVFMSSDSYRLLLDENQSKKDQVEEITKEIEVFKDNVQKLTKEVEQKAKLLIGKQKELREVNDKLQETKRWLQKIQEEHEQTKRSLAEQIVLRKYHEEYGDKLQSLATKTISTLQNTVQDNNGLFQKLDRLRLVQDENRAVLQSFKGDFDLKAQSIFDEMLQFKSLIDSMQSELQEKAKDHATGLQKSLSTINHGVESRLKALEHDTDTLHNLAKEGSAVQTGLYDVLLSLQKEVEQSTRKTKEIAKQEADAFMKVTNAALQKFYDQLTAKQSLLSDMLAVYVNGMKKASSEQLEHLEQMRTRFTSGLENEKVFIRTKEDQLKQIVELQHENRNKAKKQLMYDISLLLTEYDSEHHQSLQQSMLDVQTSLHSNAAMLDDLHYDHDQQVDQLVNNEKSNIQAAEEHRFKVMGQLDSFVTFKRDIEDLEGEQSDYHDRMRALRDELSEKLSIVNEKINGSVKAARSKQGDILDLHTEEINKMQKTNLSVRNGVSSRVSEIISQSNEQVHNIHRWVKENQQVNEKHKLTTDKHIEQMQNDIRNLVRSKVKEDISSGATPIRKSYNIPDSLAPRLSNEDMIRRLQSTNADIQESKLSSDHLEEEYSAKPSSPVSHPKSESAKYDGGSMTIKQEKDTAYNSDIQKYPTSIAAKYQNLRTVARTVTMEPVVKAKTLSSGVGNNESALKDKTNGNKLTTEQADGKPLKRRLPTDPSDTLYKRRKAPESNFWRT
ncbi:Kinesin-related motor protein [Umbelopsis sp. WA50703]